MSEIENLVLKSDKQQIEELMTIQDPNILCPSGPLFCILVKTGKLTIVGIQNMCGRLDFGSIHLCGVAHRFILREIENNYSNYLWGIFVMICQHTNFVETIPSDDMFDVFFGKIILDGRSIKPQHLPPLIVFKLLLSYDDRRIKKRFLERENFTLRHCLKQAFPHYHNCIINC